MIEVTGTYERLSFRPDGDAEITFRIPAKLRGSLMAGIDKVLETGVKDLCIKVGRKRKKRSLDANAYMWKLVTNIAEKLQDDKVYVTKEEVYRKHIRSVGVYEPLALREDAVERFTEEWAKRGTGWLTEVVDSTLNGCKKVFAYYGSSTYTVEEMSRLIESVIQDCMALGIETMPQAELDSLLNSWGKKNESKS
jgi:hypothetical protein